MTCGDAVEDRILGLCHGAYDLQDDSDDDSIAGVCNSFGPCPGS